MTEHIELIVRYIDCWNEADAHRRRALIARTWTEDASYVDPLMHGTGHDAIDAMIEAVQRRFPGFRFSLTRADGLHEFVRFSWELGPEGGAALIEGSDFGVVASDGRLQMIRGFLDRVPEGAVA
ncbi:MAG TPA: nuclear transport factor 2 family protein [Gemmatimonadaceae bacterium]|nr:nuclear transport factor 2 family protein [Gemmatimonadaceae bacterium]